MIGQAAVDILLATYNGERFLAAQLDSIVSQTYDDWRILARDDGSTDETRDILRGYAGDHPERIVVIEDDDQGLGARGNFERLMQHSDARYIMLCDQDDVWLADKISRLLEALRKLEKQHGEDIPLLVHSDLKVVGPDCEELHPSFFAYQGIDPSYGQCINRLLVQNVVTGCASICNRSLVDRALPIPAEAAMHDWWLALVAACFGQVAHITEATVLYRQHGGNVIGARPIRLWGMLRRGIRSPVASISRERRLIMARELQARALLRQYGGLLAKPVLDTVSRFASLSGQGFLMRRVTVARRRYLAKRLLPKLMYFIFI